MIVFTNGCFDLLGPHHCAFLQDARSLGDKLVVGLNSDASVRRLKGQARPIYPVDQRRAMLEALRSVDSVVVFDTEEELRQLIKRVNPAILAKGAEYLDQPITGSELVHVVLIPRRVSCSTTGLLERIRA